MQKAVAQNNNLRIKGDSRNRATQIAKYIKKLSNLKTAPSVVSHALLSSHTYWLQLP